MSEKQTPEPGEIWRYECPMIGDRVGVVDAAGRVTVIDGDNDIPRDARPAELIGYSARYVEQLRAGPEGDWSKLSREFHAAEAERDNLRNWLLDAEASLGQAVELAEKTESELKAERDKVRAPGLDEIARDKPWRVLRAADALIRGHWNFDGNDSVRLLALADEFEREHAEKSRRDRVVEAAREAFKAESGIDTTPIDGWMEAVVDAVLAEAGDVQ